MQNRQATKKSVMEVINPVEISVSGMRGVSKKGVAVICDNPKALDGVKQICQEKLGENYDINIPKVKHPRIKISGLSEMISKEDLKRMLIAQNDLSIDDRNIEVVAMRETRRGVYIDAILEVPPDLYDELLRRGRLKIGWDLCYVADGVDVRRCLRCCSHTHLISRCKQEHISCPKCSGNHNLKDCKSAEESCANCLRANAKLGLKLNTEHSAMSRECPVYIRELRRFREKISILKP